MTSPSKAAAVSVATPVLTAAQITGAGTFIQQRVKVPGWDGVVIISEITAAEVEAWQNYVNAPTSDAGEGGEGAGGDAAPAGEMSRVRVMASLLVRCITDADGKRLFSDGDEAIFTGKPLNTLSRLFTPAAVINGIDVDAEEDAAGNLNAGQTFASSSSSPNGSA